MSFRASEKRVGAFQKHRACDECRSRKLACTKEIDGCYRCRRENIPCHYSPQKPMGRPRKRVREESVEESHSDATAADVPPAKMTMTDLPLEAEDPGLQFVNFILGGRDFDTSPMPQPIIPAEEPVAMGDQPWEQQGWGMGDVFSQAPERAQSYGTLDIDPSLSAPRIEPSSLSLDRSSAISPLNLNAGGFVGSSSSSATPNSASLSVPNCDCMNKLYSALNAMQRLPVEVEAAVREARLAAKVAYEVVNCTACSIRAVQTIHQNVTGGSASGVQCFQTLMLLATLIPSIVHAYATMLVIVDEAMNRAISERRNIVFQLDALGGIWGCNVKGMRHMFVHKEMEPALWRLTVRALMRFDVYGVSGDCAAHAPLHLGLKDLVALMECKARERHALGDMLGRNMYVHANDGEGRIPTCQQVVAIARQAIEQLHIP